MSLKIKLNFAKSVATIIGLLCVSISSFVFQGCEKDENYFLERSEIVNSIEFEEYIAANIELVSVFQKANAMLKNDDIRNSMKIGVSPEGATYRTCPFIMDENLLKNVSTKRAAFMKKFPSFQTYETESKKELIQKAMVISEPINELFLRKGLNLKEVQFSRLKSGGVESPDTYAYSGYMNALMYAMDWAYENQFECSGYIFAGGGAIIYINPNATHSRTSYPGPVYNICNDGADVTIYNGQVVQSTFHTHFNSPLFSNPNSNPGGPNDQTVQSNKFPNSDLIILYNCNIYIYHFEHGIYMP